MAFLSEAAVEQALLDQFQTLGYHIEREESIAKATTRSFSGSGSRGRSHA